MKTEVMNVADIKLNEKNPRNISEIAFRKLVTSMQEFPEMQTARPLVLNKDHVVLGGNMRLKAMLE